MSEENFCSTCRGYKFDKHITNALKDMRTEKDFNDVTLACGNDQILAHKVILAAYSPFFRNILIRNPHPHPLIYLKGADYKDIQAILNYMYIGQVNVPQESVKSFLALAKDLEIKGLEKAYNSPDESTSDDGTPGPKVYEKTPRPQTSANKNPSQESSRNQESLQPSSNEKPPLRSVKKSRPCGQMEQNVAGVRSRSSSAESKSPPSKYARHSSTGSLPSNNEDDDHINQDTNDESAFTSASGVKRGTSLNEMRHPTVPTVPTAPGSSSIPQEIQEMLNASRPDENECSIVSPPGSTVPSTGSVHTDDYGDDTEDMRRFQIFKKEQLELTNDLVVCKICSLTFPKRRQFNAERHLLNNHFGPDDEPCPDCGQFFKNKESLYKHRHNGYCPIAKKVA